MHQVTQLRDALRPHLAWHGARLTFLALFLIALLRVRSVNFATLAQAFYGQAQTDSHYKRLQRFFRDYDFEPTALTRAAVSLLNIPQPWALSLDRTEWCFGQTVYNILVLAVVHEGVAIPVVWQMLDKRGNSNTRERMSLYSQWLKYFGHIEIDFLSADREFVGQYWFSYLKTAPNTPFRIRIRHNYRLFDGRRSLSVATLFANLTPSQQRVLRRRRRLWGHWVFIAASRLEDGSLPVVATTHKPRSAIADYAKRWTIETLFGILKSRGFRLEDTHLRDGERVSKLLALLGLALAWALHVGLWQHQLKPLKLKAHGRRAKSLFRYGLDYLSNIMHNLDHKAEPFTQVVQFLSCT